MHRHLRTCKLLVEYGHDVNRKVAQGDGLTGLGTAAAGDTMLMLAANLPCLELVQVLLALDADPNLTNAATGRAVLHNAAKRGAHVMVQVLLGKGLADPNILDGEGRSPLSELCSGTAGDPHATCALLLAQGAAIDHRHGPEFSPAKLQAAADGKQVAGVARSDTAVLMPMALAAANGHLETLKLLIAHKGDVNDRYDGVTGLAPLLAAAANGQAEAVQLLLEAGARPTATTPGSGRNVLQLAVSSGAVKLVAVLLRWRVGSKGSAAAGGVAGTTADTADAAADTDDTDDTPHWSHELSLDQLDEDGCTVLGRVLAHRHPKGMDVVDAVRLLLDCGCSPTKHTKHLRKQTMRPPLAIAVVEGHCDAAKLLIERGASATTLDENGWETPLMVRACV